MKEIQVIGHTRRDGAFHVSALRHRNGSGQGYDDWNTVLQILRIRAEIRQARENPSGFIYSFSLIFGDYTKTIECCFSRGYWINDAPWRNDLGWKN